MQLYLRVPAFAPIPEVVDFTLRCEKAGFHGVGFLDSPFLNRDVFVTLSQAAVATSQLQLAAAVTNPITRHVSVLASAAKSVEELAPGRLAIWIGRGETAVKLAGLPHASVGQIRSTVLTLKRLLAGEWDIFPGVHSRMRYGGDSRVPIYIAASGPKTMRLAGEIADGALLNIDLNPKTLEWARKMVTEGAMEIGRDPAEIDVVLCPKVCIRDDRDEALAWASPLCAQRLSNTAWLQEMGIDIGRLKAPQELLQLYPDVSHAEDWGRAMELSKFLPRDLLSQMCEVTGIIGNSEDCIRRLNEIQTAGFATAYLQPVGTYDFPETELRLFQETIGSAIAMS